jgi:hypothetical protein
MSRKWSSTHRKFLGFFVNNFGQAGVKIANILVHIANKIQETKGRDPGPSTCWILDHPTASEALDGSNSSTTLNLMARNTLHTVKLNRHTRRTNLHRTHRREADQTVRNGGEPSQSWTGPVQVLIKALEHRSISFPSLLSLSTLWFSERSSHFSLPLRRLLRSSSSWVPASSTVPVRWLAGGATVPSWFFKIFTSLNSPSSPLYTFETVFWRNGLDRSRSTVFVSDANF